MSTLPRLQRMRIVALPLTTKTRTRDALTYYQFITRAPDATKEQSILNRATNKAAGVWNGFGKAEGGWKLKVFQYGERIIDRIDFEELALASLDPSLGPKISKFGKPDQEVGDKRLETEHTSDTSPIALIHPKFYSLHAPEDHMRRLLEARRPKHQRGFWTFAGIAPLTAPFAILPVIPNLPFFFCVWRAWSHWKAFKASDYLLTLSQRGAIESEENSELDRIYAQYGPSHSVPPSDTVSPVVESPSAPSAEASRESPAADAPQASSDDSQQPQLLLSRDAVPSILQLLALPDSAAGEMYRAIEQARQRTTRV